MNMSNRMKLYCYLITKRLSSSITTSLIATSISVSSYRSMIVINFSTKRIKNDDSDDNNNTNCSVNYDNKNGGGNNGNQNDHKNDIKNDSVNNDNKNENNNNNNNNNNKKSGSFMEYFNNFIKDWKEMQEAMKPIPDTNETLKSNPPKSIFQLDWSITKKILTESKDLYYQTLTDRDAAIKIIEDDDLFIKLRKEAQEKSIKEHNDFDDNNFRKNVDDLIKEFKLNHKDVSMNSIFDKKKQVNEIATDRLEVMGIALREFMDGYREGRDISMKQTMEDKSLDHYIDGITNMDASPPNDISKNDKTKQ